MVSNWQTTDNNISRLYIDEYQPCVMFESQVLPSASNRANRLSAMLSYTHQLVYTSRLATELATNSEW